MWRVVSPIPILGLTVAAVAAIAWSWTHRAQKTRRRKELKVARHWAAMMNQIVSEYEAAKQGDSQLDCTTPTISIDRSPPIAMATNLHQPSDDAHPPVLPVLERYLSTSVVKTDAHAMPTRVIGVCGMSCSGKSTVTSTVRQHTAKMSRTFVPVICCDDLYFESFIQADPASASVKSKSRGRDHAWKNWESPKCVDWVALEGRLRETLNIFAGISRYVIIEGFLLLENERLRDMCDLVIAIEVSKDVAWQRRLQRSLKFKAGHQDCSAQDDYEFIETYAAPHDFDAIEKAATALVDVRGAAAVYPAKGADANRTAVDLSCIEPGYRKPADYQRHAYQTVRDFDWLYLYFEEVIWPEAVAVAQTVNSLASSLSVRARIHKIDGDQTQASVKQNVLKLMSLSGTHRLEV